MTHSTAMRMRKRGVLVALLATMLVGALVAWLVYPHVGARLVRHGLAGYGIEVVEIAPLSMSGRTITLPRLVMHHPSLASTAIRLDGVTVVLKAPPLSDLLHLDVEAVTVTQAFIDKLPVSVMTHIEERRASITLAPTSLSDPALTPLLQRFAPQLSSYKLSGELEAVVTHSPTQTSLRVELHSGQAVLLGAPVSGIHGFLHGQLLPHLATIEPAELRVSRIETLTPISELRAQVAVHNANMDGRYDIELLNARAALLGGVVSVPPTRLQSTSEPRVNLRLRGIDLAQLLALYPQSTLKATGKLRGTIPVILGRSGLSVQEGVIVADPPNGILQASLPDGALPEGQGGQVALVRNALRNFQYTKLEADLTADPSGALHLATRLAGSNPDLNNGQPLNVNIGIDENILDLLGSIRAARNVAEQF